jgi:hypothetical protein
MVSPTMYKLEFYYMGLFIIPYQTARYSGVWICDETRLLHVCFTNVYVTCSLLILHFSRYSAFECRFIHKMSLAAAESKYATGTCTSNV